MATVFHIRNHFHMTVTCGAKRRTAPKETQLKVVLLGLGLVSVYQIKKALKGVLRNRNDLRAPWGSGFHNSYLRHTDKTYLHKYTHSLFRRPLGAAVTASFSTGPTIRHLFYYKVLSWNPAKSQATSRPHHHYVLGQVP